MNKVANYLSELIKSQFENRKPIDIPTDISVQELYSIAVKGHIEYLILGALLKADNLQDEYKNAFRNHVFKSVSKTLMQTNEIKNMERIFEEKGIKNQPMKGARMKFIYPSPEMREMSDIDVLIHPECMDDAIVALQGMGYTVKKDIKHHIIFEKQPFMAIEAHHAMYDKTVDKNQYKYFSDLSRSVLRDGCSYTYDFTCEDFYVYMIAHMAKHFYTMGCGIRNLLDIYVYLKAKSDTMDRLYVDLELKKLGLFSFTKQMEELATVWMDGTDSTEFQQQIFDYMLDGGIYGKDENGIWNKFADEKLKDKEISRARLKQWYYFPPVSYMAEYYPWLQEHPYLLPVAWCIRAYGGIFKKKGSHKRAMLHEISDIQIRERKKIYQEMQLHFK